MSNVSNGSSVYGGVTYTNTPNTFYTAGGSYMPNGKSCEKANVVGWVRSTPALRKRMRMLP